MSKEMNIETIPASEDASRPKVEIGWIIDEDLPRAHLEAAGAAAAAMQRSLTDCLPRFEWVLETLERPLGADGDLVEPVRLLDAAEIDRDMRGWDFAFVVTGKRLRGRARSRVLGVTSGIFATALVSAAFLDAPERGAGRMSRRLQSLALHLLGRLNGLSPGDSGTWMQRVELPDDLEEMCGFGPRSIKELRSRLEDVADLRVEEMGEPRQGRLGFYASSLWQNRSALPRAIVRMRPWSFPLRLRRLTTAAGSALAVLVMTAESWEVAANLSFGAITVLSLITLTATSAYLLKAQRLLTSRQGPLREHRAVSNAGTVIAVAIGMLVTYLGVFAIAWLMASGLFGDALLESWIGPAEKPSSVRVQMAAFAASLSVVIGALGASFEPYGYFRHVTQVDDEI